MDRPWKVEGCTDAELAEAYFNSWQSAHKEVCRLELLIAEKDREIERLKETIINQDEFLHDLAEAHKESYIQKDKEIKRLHDTIATQDREIERLKNIIDADMLLKKKWQEDGDG